MDERSPQTGPRRISVYDELNNMPPAADYMKITDGGRRPYVAPDDMLRSPISAPQPAVRPEIIDEYGSVRLPSGEIIPGDGLLEASSIVSQPNPQAHLAEFTFTVEQTIRSNDPYLVREIALRHSMGSVSPQQPMAVPAVRMTPPNAPPAIPHRPEVMVPQPALESAGPAEEPETTTDEASSPSWQNRLSAYDEQEAKRRRQRRIGKGVIATVTVLTAYNMWEAGQQTAEEHGLSPYHIVHDTVLSPLNIFPLSLVKGKI